MAPRSAGRRGLGRRAASSASTHWSAEVGAAERAVRPAPCLAAVEAFAAEGMVAGRGDGIVGRSKADGAFV